MTTPPTEWAANALCRREGHPTWWDVDLDGVPESDAQRSRRQAKAKAICRRCPVIDACFANTRPGDTGVRHAVLLGIDHPDEKVPPMLRHWGRGWAA